MNRAVASSLGRRVRLRLIRSVSEVVHAVGSCRCSCPTQESTTTTPWCIPSFGLSPFPHRFVYLCFTTATARAGTPSRGHSCCNRPCPPPSSDYPLFTLQALDAGTQVPGLGTDQRLEPRHRVREPLIHVALQVADPHIDVPVLRKYTDIHDDERHDRAEHWQVGEYLLVHFVSSSILPIFTPMRRTAKPHWPSAPSRNDP